MGNEYETNRVEMKWENGLCSRLRALKFYDKIPYKKNKTQTRYTTQTIYQCPKEIETQNSNY